MTQGAFAVHWIVGQSYFDMVEESGRTFVYVEKKGEDSRFMTAGFNT